MLSILFLSVLFSSECLGAKILAVIPTPSYSHQIAFQPLFKELSLRGHQLTVITTDPINDKTLTNLTEIDVKFAYKILQDEIVNLVEARQQNFIAYMRAHLKVFDTLVSKELEHPEVQKLLHDPNQQFDLVMVEMIHQAMFAFSKRFNCPSIAVCSFEGFPQYFEVVGHAMHPLKFMSIQKSIFSKNSIFDKVTTYMNYLIKRWMCNDLTSADEIVQKYFGKDYPPLQNILKDIDLVFSNSDPIFHAIEKSTPIIVKFGGGAHISTPKPLSKNFQDILDGSTQPIIYFSMGSNINSKDLPIEKRNMILQTFVEIPYTILWKFELEELPGKPENVHISKWLLQQDILRHPNIKLFITHCGFQSLEETIYFNVPVICIPMFADQHDNAERMYQKGVALQLDFGTLTKDSFKEAIVEAMENPRYRNRMTELSNLVKDEPMTSLEKTVWWTEYVIRHKGAKHLRSFSDKYSFYEYYLLDIYAAIAVIILISITAIVFITKLFIKVVVNFSYQKLKKQ